MPRGNLDPDSIEAIRRRMIALRLAIEPNVTAFARRVGLTPTQWQNFEAEGNARRISLDAALALCLHLGVTLDWIYRGHEHMMPHALLEKIKAQDITASRKVAGG